MAENILNTDSHIVESLELRESLLAVNGIGPESADCILLYALQQPHFVIDTYTKRFLIRHQLIEPSTGYQEIKDLFETHFPREVRLYQEFHALLVVLGKRFCRTQPLCSDCPLAWHLKEI